MHQGWWRGTAGANTSSPAPLVAGGREAHRLQGLRHQLLCAFCILAGQTPGAAGVREVEGAGWASGWLSLGDSEEAPAGGHIRPRRHPRKPEAGQWCEMGDWMLLDSGLWGLGSPWREMLAPRD